MHMHELQVKFLRVRLVRCNNFCNGIVIHVSYQFDHLVTSLLH